MNQGTSDARCLAVIARGAAVDVGVSELVGELEVQARLWDRLSVLSDPRRPAPESAPSAPRRGLEEYLTELAGVAVGNSLSLGAAAETCLRRLGLLNTPALAGHASLPAALRVVSVDPSGRDAALLTLSVPSAQLLRFAGRGGQHVTLHLEVDGVPIRRSYSLVSGPSRIRDTQQLVLGVRRQPGGVASALLVDRVRGGDLIAVSPPAGTLTRTSRGSAGSLLLIGAGSGVTPLVSLAEEALDSTACRVRLVIVERESADVIGGDLVQSMCDRFGDRLAVSVWETTHRGRPVAADLVRALVELERQGNQQSPAEAFICGPQGFIDEALACAALLGVSEDDVHTESFLVGGPIRRAARPGGAVVIELHGASTHLDVRPGESILGAAVSMGLDVPYSCLSGSCGTCAVRVVAGDVEPLSPPVLGGVRTAEGWVLACQAAPR